MAHSSSDGLRHTDVVHSSSMDKDAAQLAALGHTQELKRNFSFFSMLGMGFAVLNSWVALAASLPLSLPSGGPSSAIWGLISGGFCYLCLAASLAEFVSAYPTAAGQYHWAAIASPKKLMPIISYVTGWITTVSWISVGGIVALLGSQLIIGAISFMSPTYTPQHWHQFLIYIGYTLVAVVTNVLLTRLLPVASKMAFIWSLSGFVIICITLLSCASPDYQSGNFVYTAFLNDTGWPDGLAWLLGLVQGSLALAGFDSVAHMIEELPAPTRTAPKSMMLTVSISIFTGFIVLSVLLFVLKDVDRVISSPAGPLLQIFLDATSNKAGSICLLVFPIVCFLFADIGIMTTSSRMTYAFARDGGLPFSRVFAKVHKGLDLPLNALLLTAGGVIIFGCIFLGSTSAYNAIISAGVVSVQITYAIPPAINCLRGRKMLLSNRDFILPSILGWICNIVGIAFVILTSVLYVFPPFLPVTGSNMNYCIVAFALVLVIATTQWIFNGRKNYRGPRVDFDALEQLQVARVNGETIGNNDTEISTLNLQTVEKQTHG